jgi:inner membrane protein
MQKALYLKTFAVIVLTLLIGVPLSMIQSTISERLRFRDEAVRSIAADSVREQTLVGPILVIPYTETWEEDQTYGDKQEKIRKVQRSEEKQQLLFPNEMQINGTIDTDRRYRGIHKVLVYSGQHKINGDFVLPQKSDITGSHPGSTITLGNAYVGLSIEDVRGIRNIPSIDWGGQRVEFRQGAFLPNLAGGLHAPLGVLPLKEAASVKFNFDLGLDGIERMTIAPIAKNNQVTLTSKWPHPQFGGRFLPSPKARRIDANGFTATWSISALATNAQQQFFKLDEKTALPEKLDTFSVGFIEPINIYSQADRAIKYGLLFVALTFAAFFLFELLKQLPVHPIQYVLVGLALTLFFLLLVSLSEHLPFDTAYLIASAACISLIGFYLSYVLRDWKRGFGFGAGLTLLYGALFGLLQSENNALAMGSILLFSVLAAIMIATRKVDWYQIGKPKAVAA